ncbi:putative transcriptional regulatory protein NarL [Paraconexibacter sp. AEG42_29]|uniref:Transcriptional regulatory protein NarL n=1 Tax=Paraconexibacter sp. AEG42_29 TaxID=2997339 RepID=A0AAU7ARP2_9ACTN
MSALPLTVVIADDSDAYRSGIARAVRAHGDLELVGEAIEGDGALAAIAELAPDVALLDVRMPGLDGLEVCERLRALNPAAATRVVLLSAYMDDAVVARAREAGADAYMSKTATRGEICSEAIRVVRGLQ